MFEVDNVDEKLWFVKNYLKKIAEEGIYKESEAQFNLLIELLIQYAEKRQLMKDMEVIRNNLSQND